VSLEADLTEWARWLSQGRQVTAGYPSESPTEHIAIPYKRCDTAEEQHDDFMATCAADEIIGARVNAWVDSLYEPFRTVIRYHYVHMPLEDKKGAESLERFLERRARLVAVTAYQQAMKRHEEMGEKRPTWSALTAEQYDAAYTLAMDRLGDMYQRWARGV
jgi:hypothetical protein